MDLIYMNSQKEDIGVLNDYTLDLEFGYKQYDFECTVNINNHVCRAGYYLYFEGSEYGGIIDSVSVNTETDTVVYSGRTWHGILASKIIQPEANTDYLIVNGDANTIIKNLITKLGLNSLFKVNSASSGINIASYQMNRYINGYNGILKMLKKNNAKLKTAFINGFVELSAEPLVDYSQDEQFDTDQISFKIEKNYTPINHVICLGQGELKNRRVIHMFADKFGNISGTQTQTGLDEVCVTYDNSNAESDDELKQGGFDLLSDAWASDTVDFDFKTDDESFDINDKIGAKELTTNTVVVARISSKIIKIQNGTTTISYDCEGDVGTIASGGYPTSGTGGGGGVTIEVDDAMSTTSENPVQNKVITAALADKQNKLTIDSSLNTSSSNPIQNKAVAKALQGNFKATLVGSARGSSTTLPTVDISSIAQGTVLKVIVGLKIDTTGTIAYFCKDVVKEASDYLYDCGGSYYSANYNSSVYINVSATRITINGDWTRVTGGSGAANVPVKATTTNLYVYTCGL